MSKNLPYYSSKGLDLTSSDYSRPDDYHSGMENLVLEGSADDPVIEARKGFQVKGDADKCFELIQFVRRNPTTDTEEEELLAVTEGELKRAKVASLAVSYSGAGTTCTLSLKYNVSAAQMRLTLTVDGASVLSQNLGKGFDEVSPFTITQLQTAINAITGFTATVTGTGSIPAAFLDVTAEHNLKASPATLKAYEYETIPFGANSGIYAPFELDLKLTQDQEGFEAVSHAALNNVLYIANGYAGNLMKYDGKRIYAAGLPRPSITPIQHSSGTLAAGSYNYKFRCVMTDSAGNIIYGPFSSVTTVSNSAGRAIQIDCQGTTAFINNLSLARLNGAVTGTGTCTVDSGHSLLANDIVYGLDSGGVFKTRVVSTGATTVTLENAPAGTMADNTVLSCVGIEVWRTKNAGLLYYYITTFPNDTSPGSLYIDGKADASLSEELLEPPYDFAAPPQCRYVTTFANRLAVAGIPLTSYNITGNYQRELGIDPNDVSFADLEYVEGFPSDGSYTVKFDSKLGDKITGIKELGSSLIVGKEKSIARMTGEPIDLQIQVDWLSKEVGVLAAGSMQELNGQLVFLSERGIESLSETQAPRQDFGYRIQTILENKGLTSTQRLKFKRAKSHVFTKKQYYILSIPAEGGTAVDSFTYTFLEQGDGAAPGTVTIKRLYSNSNSRVFVYDYLRSVWYEWRDLNMSGGIATFQDELWFAERAYSTFDAAVKSRVRRRLNNYDASDYEDHTSAIIWRLKTAWYAASAPKLFKQFIRAAFGVIPRIPNNSCTMTLKQEVNYLADSIKAQTSISLNADSKLGISQPQTRLADGKYKSIRLTFEGSAHNSSPEIEGWEIEVDAPYIEELKR